MAQLPSPFDSDPAQFTTVVTMARELLHAGKVRLKASPGGNISYNVDASDLRAAAEKRGIRTPRARAILSEISAMTSLILRGRFEVFINDILERPLSGSSPRLTSDEKTEAKSILLEKFQRVENELVTQRVKQKFYGARASKHETLMGIKWEVTERKYDSDEGDKASGPITLLRFELASRPEFEVYPIYYGMDASHRRNFLIECDEDDIDDIINTLTEAKRRLAQERPDHG